MMSIHATPGGQPAVEINRMLQQQYDLADAMRTLIGGLLEEREQLTAETEKLRQELGLLRSNRAEAGERSVGSSISGYAVVLTYSDGSGIQGAFGPYPTHDAADDSRAGINEMPLADGSLEVVALFGTPGQPTREA